MVVGITLLKLDGSDYFSPTFSRGGLSALFSLEVLIITATALGVIVEHKNLEDTSFTTAGTFSSITSTGVKTLTVTGLKEEIRLKFTLTGSNAYDAVHINVLAPAWRPY